MTNDEFRKLGQVVGQLFHFLKSIVTKTEGRNDALLCLYAVVVIIVIIHKAGSLAQFVCGHLIKVRLHSAATRTTLLKITADETSCGFVFLCNGQ